MIRVAVFGAGGRMGRTVCEAVALDRELELVAAIDPQHRGIDLRQATGVDVPGVMISGDAEELADRLPDVAVDFTHISAARENAAWCAHNGVHAVIGTTGLNDDDYATMGKEFTRSNCFVAPNFAVGAVLMMRFAELAAPFFESVEVVELHHDAKADAPSGTALMTARRVAEASGDWAPGAGEGAETVPGARGAAGPGGIRIHSVRMRGLVAHQEVILGTTGQTLSLRHDSYDRASFMPGVLLAVKSVAERPGVTVGLDALLGS